MGLQNPHRRFDSAPRLQELRKQELIVEGHRLPVLSEEEAGTSGSGFAVVPDQHAIHKYFFDACGKSGGTRVRRAVNDRFGIKEKQVGPGTIAKDAAVFPAEALRG